MAFASLKACTGLSGSSLKAHNTLPRKASWCVQELQCILQRKNAATFFEATVSELPIKKKQIFFVWLGDAVEIQCGDGPVEWLHFGVDSENPQIL